MSVQHRKDSIRGMRLERLGIQPPSDWNNVEQVRAVKKQEIGAECSAAIYAGVDVGGSHYSLTEHDQTELLAQAQAVKEGAAAVPYHADGELCRMYPAEEFTALAQAATAHVFYHRTYCNHVNAWIARALPNWIPLSTARNCPRTLQRVWRRSLPRREGAARRETCFDHLGDFGGGVCRP